MNTTPNATTTPEGKKTLGVRRPKITTDYKAAETAMMAASFAEVITVPEGQTLTVGSRILMPGQHVIAVQTLGPAYIAQFGICVGKAEHKVKTTRWQHYTKTRGIEACPIKVTMGCYIIAIGREEMAVEELKARLKEVREARKVSGDTGRTRTVGIDANDVDLETV